jgi:hypothetical protein
MKRIVVGELLSSVFSRPIVVTNASNSRYAAWSNSPFFFPLHPRSVTLVT